MGHLGLFELRCRQQLYSGQMFKNINYLESTKRRNKEEPAKAIAVGVGTYKLHISMEASLLNIKPTHLSIEATLT